MSFSYPAERCLYSVKIGAVEVQFVEAAEVVETQAAEIQVVAVVDFEQKNK